MTLSVNKQQVENIISNLTDVVADAHVGMLNDNEEVTQTASKWYQKFFHWVKTAVVGNADVIRENLAILNSYKAMVTRNLGEVYCKVFSDRMRSVEDKGFYSVGNELANELRSVVARYNSDLEDDELFNQVELRAHEATSSPAFKASVHGRMEAELVSRNIPKNTEGLDTVVLEATITERYCHALQDFYMRNDREPDLREQSQLMDRAVNQAFQRICKQRCEDLCTNYTFLDATSADSVDGKLKTALAAKELNVKISPDYLAGLVESVQKGLRNSPGFLTQTAVKNCIADVVAKAIQHDHVEPEFDTLLVKNMVSTGAHPRMFTVVNEATMKLNSIMQVFAKNPGTTAEGLNSVLSGFCTHFMESCNKLVVQPRPEPDQQNATFTAVVKSAVEYCLSDSPAMSETRALLLEHSNDLLGANSAFVTNLYKLSESLSAHTNPHAAKMLTLCRTLVSTLNEKLVNASSELNNLNARNAEKLTAKKQELADSVERCKKFIQDNPTQQVKDARAATLKTLEPEITKYNKEKEKAQAFEGRTQAEKNAYIQKIDDYITDLIKAHSATKVDRNADRAVVKNIQAEIAALREAIVVIEKKAFELSGKSKDVGGELQSRQAVLKEMHQQIEEKQGILGMAKEGVQLADIEDFKTYIAELKTSGLALHQPLLQLQREVDAQVELQATLKQQVKQISADPQKSPTMMNDLSLLAMRLQESNRVVNLLQNEMQNVGNETRDVAAIVHDATTLQTHISTLQNDIQLLKDAQNLKHLSDEELKKNATAVKYLSTGKDFGGFLNFSDYKEVHGSVPMRNDVGLTQPEKDSLKQFIHDEIKNNATKERNIGFSMNMQKAQLESQIDLEPNASEEEKKQAQKKLKHVEQTMEGSPFLSSYGYTAGFIKDLEKGLSVTVNGKKLSSPSPNWSDPNKATAYSNISKEFPDIEIAGKVLSPFTLDISKKLFGAMTGDVKSIPQLGISQHLVDYTLFGNEVQSVSDVHVDALENGQYAVTYYASSQKDNGTYAHHMFKCTVSDLDKTTPTFTVNDMDVVYHVDPHNNEIVENDNNIEQPQNNNIEQVQNNNIEQMQNNNIDQMQNENIEQVQNNNIEQVQNNNIEQMQNNNIEQPQNNNIEQMQNNNIEQMQNNNIEQPQNNNIKDTRLAENKRALTNLMQSGVNEAFADEPLPNRQGLTRYLVDMSDVDEHTSAESLQAMVHDAILYAQGKTELREQAKLLAPMDISTDELLEHAGYIGHQLSDLCASLCAPDTEGNRPELDEQGFYSISLLDSYRDRPVINGVQLAQSQSTDVVVQDYKEKMLNFAPNQEEREVVSILMSQDHLMIPGGFLIGNPPNLPLGEPFQGGSSFIRKPSVTSDEVRYTLDRNVAGDAVIHISMGIECAGLIGTLVYAQDTSGKQAQVGTLSYDVKVPHDQFSVGLLGFPPLIVVENMRVTPSVY